MHAESKSGRRVARPPLPSLKQAVRAHIERVRDACGNNLSATADVLEIDRKTLYRHIRRSEQAPAQIVRTERDLRVAATAAFFAFLDLPSPENKTAAIAALEGVAAEES